MHILLRIVSIGVLISLVFTGNVNAEKKSYHANVGDIAFNAQTDDANFPLTGKKIMQYYSFFPGVAIDGEKQGLRTIFENNYHAYNLDDTGYITIRFIVNYKGETDRFRVTQMDQNYHVTQFNTETVSQILSITQGITTWKIAARGDKCFDYYQYLLFIIEDGQIKEILP
ncbi:hypothetical protein OAT16_09945 [Prolixibacteraceae bacterium]|nr:hypothetical protein [Prolixibacteraceae bacterium]